MNNEHENEGGRAITAWHYTKGCHVPEILSSGLLLPSSDLLGPNERPVVWLTTSDEWEPTVWMTEFWKAGPLPPFGRARIGLCGRYPLTWRDFISKSGVCKYMAKSLFESAVEAGSPVAKWRVSFDAIPREQWGAVEFWDAEKELWKPHASWSLRRAA